MGPPGILMNITILNGHSILNSGDTAIILAQRRILRQVFPAVNMTLVSRTPEIDGAFYAPAGIRVIAAPFCRASAAVATGKKILALLRDCFAWSRFARLAAAIRRSDLLLSCGGGYLFSFQRRFPGPTFWQIYLQIRLALALGKPVILLPQSYGPFRNRFSRFLVGRLIVHPQMKKVLAREEISLKLLKSLPSLEESAAKISLCPDLAWAYLPGSGPAIPEIDGLPRPRIAITAISWSFPEAKNLREKAEKQERYLQTMVDICQTLHRQLQCSLLLISHSRGPSPAEDDLRITRRLFERIVPGIPAEYVHLRQSANGDPPDAIIAILKKSDLIISSRFHAAILGLLAEIPIVVIGYHHKSEGIMNLLGLRESFTSIQDLKADWVIAQATKRMARAGPEREKIRELVRRQRENVERELSTLLAGAVQVKNEDPADQ